MSRETSVSVRIVETIAAHEGEDPATLEPPLYDVVDTDVLDELVQSSAPSAEVQVTFTYRGYTVCVDADGVRVLDTISGRTSGRAPSNCP